MKFARYLSFLVIGMLTSMVFLSVAFRLDFRTFASDLFAPLQEEDTFVAAFTAPENIAPMVVPEMEQIAVTSQVTIHRALSNSINLTGVVPTWQICEEIEGYCQKIFPNAEFSNEIRVFARASDPQWMVSLKAMASLEEVARVRNTSIALSDSIVEMTGSVPTKQLKSEILAAIETGVSGVEVPVAARLSVRTVAPELDMWMADESTLLVQGVLDAKSKASLVAKINANLGERRMVETITTDADAASPAWLEAVETMIPDFLTNVAPEQLRVKEGKVVLRGATGTSQIASAFGSFVQRAFPKSAYSVTNELVIKEGLGLKGSKIGLSADALATASDSLFDVLSSSTIYFGSGRTGLGSGDKRKLKKLASVIQRDGAAKIEIVGHCDPSGDAALNAALAKRRCGAAFEYLVAQGVPQERFIVNPVGSSGKSGGRSSEQRRVDFRISSGLLSQLEQAIPETSQANPTMKPIALDGDEAERLTQVKAYAGATKVYFATARYTVNREHRQQLDQLAAYLRSFDKLSPQLHVRGLADPRGDATFNLALSRKRCKAVIDYLKQKGVREDVITMEEKGATKVSVDDSAALRESRRVEFTLKSASITNA